MKKLTTTEMKNVKGGNSSAGGRTVCVSCGDTPGYYNQVLGNVMCTKEKPGQVCVAMYGTGHNGLMCMDMVSYDYVPYNCPVG
jgi:hypothetical protein